MRQHLFRKIPSKRWGIGELDFLDYQEGNQSFELGDIYGNIFELNFSDLDRLIEVLQELKVEVENDQRNRC